MTDTAPLFLSAEELRELTGYAIKAKQIAQLRSMAVPFRVNGCGRPVVTRSAVEGSGKASKEAIKPAWQPKGLPGFREAA